jgi:hypothetical protein
MNLTVLPLPKNPLKTVTGSLGFFLLRLLATICINMAIPKNSFLAAEES